ncbi:MAG: RecX family transcriptional regulator [Bacteroidales bacterium]|nr:RecX family transcriptional regulator [Bacteroidales bacterium]MCF8388997.1 RecX family transcriptional regulator [Bacteroidales bacterium]MCF8397238.1 RecX family transcriptional regulator [Bacteroidales bacterium]
MSPDFEFLYDKMQHYCSYQERCILDVQKKLQSWNMQPKVIDDIIRKLIHERYIDEERFARVFAGGKFRINKWGKNKIFSELSRKKIPDIYIQMALQEIDDEEYLQTLREILTKKENLLKVDDPLKRKNKLIQYASSKGYSLHVILKAMDGMND